MSDAAADSPAEEWDFVVTVRSDPDTGVFTAVCDEHPDIKAEGLSEEEVLDAVTSQLIKLVSAREHIPAAVGY
jgi:hypothetical protein